MVYEKSSTKQTDDNKLDKLQQLCHIYELQLEERTVYEQKLMQELQQIKRKYQDLQKNYSKQSCELKYVSDLAAQLEIKNQDLN